jgi:xanthine dehydrogenase YagR molybdenum-binding subunit
VLDLPEANAMRAPGEATGHMALEVAMDELAEKLAMDPVELRIRNDTQVVPDNSPPSRRTTRRARSRRAAQNEPSRRASRSRSASWCSACAWAPSASAGTGATRPGQVRDGRWLVGMGVAAAYRGAPVTKSAARVRLDRRGMVTVETDMTDIGTGSYTIIAQTAAEMMGVPLNACSCAWAIRTFPVSAGSGGQWGAPAPPPACTPPA